MTKKIRVLHIVQSLETGGLENGIVNLVNRSDTDQFQVDVLCLRAKGELAQRVSNKYSQILFDGNSDASIKVAIHKVQSTCRQGQYHIIHSHGWTTMLAGYIGGKLARTPVIMNGEHGTLYFDTWRRRLMQRLLFNRMAINLTVSEALKEEIMERFGVSGQNFKPIINGVDIDRFKLVSEEERNNTRRSLGLSEKHFIVGCVGRLAEVKNYPSLIHGFSIVAKNSPNSRLIFAGDGPMRDDLETLAKELGISEQVLFLGRRDDIHTLLNAYDIFVQPSFREGLSNTILEAMACGKPVIATKVGGNPEIVQDQETGYLIPVGDIDELAAKIGIFLDDHRKLTSFSQNARDHVVKTFSLDGMVRNYENAYFELVRDRV